jgi:hypothetical protein
VSSTDSLTAAHRLNFFLISADTLITDEREPEALFGGDGSPKHRRLKVLSLDSHANARPRIASNVSLDTLMVVCTMPSDPKVEIASP